MTGPEAFPVLTAPYMKVGDTTDIQTTAADSLAAGLDHYFKSLSGTEEELEEVKAQRCSTKHVRGSAVQTLVLRSYMKKCYSDFSW